MESQFKLPSRMIKMATLYSFFCIYIVVKSYISFLYYRREMSGCAIKHWGTGTPCIKTDSPAAKEMAAKLAQMKAERDKQDGMWTQPKEENDLEHVNKTSINPKCHTKYNK
jgi:hypothetical protein